MLAACKAAFSSRGQTGGSSRSAGPPSPSDKQVEAFIRALSDRHLDQVAAYVAESRQLLLSPLKCHPARSTAWHVAAEAGGRGRPGSASSNSSATGGGGNDSQLLELLLRLHSELELAPEGLPELVNTPNRRGQTCLHVAAARGNTAAVRLLLSHGGDLTRPDKCGRNPLHLAAAAASIECAQVLLAEAEREDGRVAVVAGAAAAPMESAAAVAGTEGGPGMAEGAVAALAAREQSQTQPQPQSQQPAAVGSTVWKLVNAPDTSGLTPLHFAAATSSLPLMRALLAAGASYTAQASADNFEAAMPCNAGWTCLHVAAMRGHYDVAMTVLLHHMSRSTEQQVADWRPGRSNRTSDPRAIPDRRGSTAAAVASARSFPDLAALLSPDTPLAQSVQGAAPVGPDGREVRPPAMFVCPITQEVMRDPAVASDGFTYERAAITKWISAGKLTSPMTNLPFTSRVLYPNNVVKSAIKEWREENQLPEPAAAPRPPGWRMAGLGLGSGNVADMNNAAGGDTGGADPFLAHLRAHGL